MYSSAAYACFLDASKAYDRINHWKLFRLLLDRQVKTRIVAFLLYWYRNQSMLVRWGECQSAPFTVTNGVRQGSIISPSLFGVYMDEFSRGLSGIPVGCYLNGNLINHLLYADDMCLLSPSAHGLSELLNQCERIASSLSIVYNTRKTQCMLFLPTRYKNLCAPTTTLYDEPLAYAKKVKYLGHWITPDLRDDLDIEQKVKAIYSRGNTLIRRFSSCSPEVKVLLFKLFITPVYGIHLWHDYNKGTFRRLVVAYNAVLRSLMGLDRLTSMSQTCVTHGIKTLPVIKRTTCWNFMTRLVKSVNHLCRALMQPHVLQLTSYGRRWYRELFVMPYQDVT